MIMIGDNLFTSKYFRNIKFRFPHSLYALFKWLKSDCDFSKISVKDQDLNS